MAGHSKWANIQHRKGREDTKRGKLFTKLVREITVSARTGAADPDANPRLRAAIAEARRNSMPNDNIKRAIEKATGTGDGNSLEEVTYEGYGPGGVAILVDVVTDNRNRTLPEIRHIFSKCGGNMGEEGSVGWQFTRRGYIRIAKSLQSEDELTETVLETGAEDYEDAGDFWGVFTAAEELHAVREAIEARKLDVESANLVMTPNSEMKISGEILTSVMKLMDMFDDHDDVQNVWNNADFDETDLS